MRASVGTGVSPVRSGSIQLTIYKLQLTISKSLATNSPRSAPSALSFPTLLLAWYLPHQARGKDSTPPDAAWCKDQSSVRPLHTAPRASRAQRSSLLRRPVSDPHDEWLIAGVRSQTSSGPSSSSAVPLGSALQTLS